MCFFDSRTYFGRNGSRYSLGRIPIGGTDFSTRPYTYDDSPSDVSLRYFSLAPEDYKYKIPYIRRAIELNPDVRFFSSAWSAPSWMKTNHRINGLLGKCNEATYIENSYEIVHRLHAINRSKKNKLFANETTGILLYYNRFFHIFTNAIE